MIKHDTAGRTATLTVDSVINLSFEHNLMVIFHTTKLVRWVDGRRRGSGEIL